MKNFSLPLLLLVLLLGVLAPKVGYAGGQSLSNENYKYQVAKKVFDALVAAKGDKRMQVPTFTMTKGKRYVAWMNGTKAEIGLEEAAYDVCISYGKDSLNALAALIGHEIIHYYEKHSWGNEFAAAFTDLGVTETVKTNAKSKSLKAMNETEADYLGGFLAYSAGFQTFSIMPRFLVDIYQKYELPSEIMGYPSLDDRSKLAVESELRLEELVHIFETANYLIVLQQHEVVDDYYSYILKEFQSREIYNNAGVNALLAALQLFNEDEEQRRFSYPIQLDDETRMSKPKPRGDYYGFAEQKEKRDELLAKAKFYFEQARALDPDYGAAYINLACVYDLTGSLEEAEFFAKKATKIGAATKETKVEGDSYIIRGIVAVHNNENSEAITHFQRAGGISPASKPLASLNLAILTGNKPTSTPTRPKISLTKEKLDGVDLDAFITSIDVDNLLELNDKVSCGIKLLTSSKILLNLIEGGQTGYTLLHLTGKNYTGATGDGIKIGDTQSLVVEKYGEPTLVQQTRQGQYLVYDFKQVVFLVKDEKVESWCLFRNKK